MDFKKHMLSFGEVELQYMNKNNDYENKSNNDKDTSNSGDSFMTTMLAKYKSNSMERGS